MCITGPTSLTVDCKRRASQQNIDRYIIDRTKANIFLYLTHPCLKPPAG